MKELTFLLVFIVLSTGFALAALIASFICSAGSSSEEKNSTYECGMQPFSNAKIQFDVKFFNYAIMFLIFDVESIFLFPFAVSYSYLKLFAIVEAAIFVILLLFALYYAVKSKVLRWI